MDISIIAASAVGGAAALGLGVPLSRRLLSYRRPFASGETAPSIAPSASLARFAPMARLLTGDDLDFLSRQPGYRPETGARLRRDQRRIFRLYLGELAAEFQRLHAAARRVLADAPEQHADLVGVLLRQQAAFWRLMFFVELRLALEWIGVRVPDTAPLLAALNQLRETVAVASSSQPATA
jgi:hypothetical protein